MSELDGPQYDYDNQAWTVVKNGVRVYERCGHPEEMECDCYGRLHAGMPVAVLNPNLPRR